MYYNAYTYYKYSHNYSSKYCPLLAATTVSHIPGRFLVEKAARLLRRLQIDPIFGIFRQNGSAVQPCHEPLIETGGSRNGLCLENMAGGVGRAN